MTAPKRIVTVQAVKDGRLVDHQVDLAKNEAQEKAIKHILGQERGACQDLFQNCELDRRSSLVDPKEH